MSTVRKSPDRAAHNPHRKHDRHTQVMMYEGVSVNMIATIFHSDTRTVRRRVQPLTPNGQRDGNPIYDLAEAATVMVKPKVDMGALVKNMKPTDLPNALRKEYWQALRLQQTYETAAGDLWPSAQVIQHVGEAFTTFRMGVLMTSDRVSREEQLTPKQRKIVRDYCDELLAELHEKLVAQFADRVRDDLISSAMLDTNVELPGDEDEEDETVSGDGDEDGEDAEVDDDPL